MMEESENIFDDLNDKKVIIGLSGGINSMAVLCWLVESGIKPKELHLFYAHFKEHSPDTFKFVKDGIRYARKHFNVKVKITRNSILEYFKKEKIIPHPKVSPCTKNLKVEPIHKYAFENNIYIDLVGYIQNEMKTRAERQQKKLKWDLFMLNKLYPIGDFSDEWCFEIVLKHIGWYPAIYLILNSKGKRVFKHNNCLPCKNVTLEDMKNIEVYYPEYFENAMILSSELNAYWGRDEALFYTTFGRELGQESSCEFCKF